jgi:hypothetical protein
MANFDSTSYTQNRPMRGPGIGGTRDGFLLASVDVPANATTADVLRFGRIPTNARTMDAWVKNDGATSVTVNIGDAGNASRFFAASVVAPGAFVRLSQASGANAVFTATTTITGALTANATGAATVTLYLEYSCEEPV